MALFGAIYLSYKTISLWVVKCRRIDAELQEIEDQMEVQRAMDRATVEAFHEELREFRAHYRIPCRGGSPVSSVLNMEINTEMERLMDERHEGEVNKWLAGSNKSVKSDGKSFDEKVEIGLEEALALAEEEASEEEKEQAQVDQPVFLPDEDYRDY